MCALKGLLFFISIMHFFTIFFTFIFTSFLNLSIDRWPDCDVLILAQSISVPLESLVVHTRATNNDDSLNVDFCIEIKPDFFGKRYARFTRLNKNL